MVWVCGCGTTTGSPRARGNKSRWPGRSDARERRLRNAQPVLARKQKGSNNRAEARIRVAKVHAKIRDARTDWAHKHATTIIRDNQARLYVEDLCVRRSARTRLAKSVHDAGREARRASHRDRPAVGLVSLSVTDE
ncbi:transposase [Nocardia sp. NPDC052112]|uniref:transposase n=1 Tax=Nocardia sp. NPDC052112 TaxID=3155646 RepID=UPI0034202239